MRKRSLFLSYARADAAIADRLRQQLADEGHLVGQDTESLLAGDSFENRTVKALHAGNP